MKRLLITLKSNLKLYRDKQFKTLLNKNTVYENLTKKD